MSELKFFSKTDFWQPGFYICNYQNRNMQCVNSDSDSWMYRQSVILLHDRIYERQQVVMRGTRIAIYDRDGKTGEEI